ncbi:transposase [Rhodococcus wratislaviensis IFP 2016]|nr:transposase [Rhodococcus wratislaviensis IFP 2016]
MTGANTHDSTMLQPMVAAIPATKSRRGPRRRKPGRLRADKGYDYDIHRRWLRERGLAHRLPAHNHSLRTPRRTLRRLPPPRRGTHLLQETAHMRHALSTHGCRDACIR